MYDEHKQYSSTAACEVAEMAEAKGLILLEGDYDVCSRYPYSRGDNCRGFCVVWGVAGQYLTLADDGSFYQDYSYGDTARCKDVWFRLTLDEAKSRIESFDGTIKNYPRFFAYIRVYKGEPEYYGFLQRLYLTEFAEKHGITYSGKVMCVGGQRFELCHPDISAGIDDVIDCCWESFSQIAEDDYLVVTDISRLNDELDIWKNSYNLIFASYADMGYTKYNYYESDKLRKMIRYYEKSIEDSEYEAMCQEHREMMFEQDEPFIEVEEEQYA